MAKHETTTLTCDNCRKRVSSYSTLDITTKEYEQGAGWQRLHVRITCKSGYHNSVSRGTDADLCQKCAIKLLADALKRVRLGERASAGVESSEMRGWKF